MYRRLKKAKKHERYQETVHGAPGEGIFGGLGL